MAAAASTIGGQKLQGLESVGSLLNHTMGRFASILYALGLLASGISATIAGTLSGQAVIEGFFISSERKEGVSNSWFQTQGKRWRTMILRAITLGLALILASTMAQLADDVLFYSQVALSLQLPLAMVPLIWNSQATLGAVGKGVAWLIAAIILLMNGAFCVLNAYSQLK